MRSFTQSGGSRGSGPKGRLDTQPSRRRSGSRSRSGHCLDSSSHRGRDGHRKPLQRCSGSSGPECDGSVRNSGGTNHSANHAVGSNQSGSHADYQSDNRTPLSLSRETAGLVSGPVGVPSPDRSRRSNHEETNSNENATLASAPSLSVEGCSNKTVRDIVEGTYRPHSVNHGKVVWIRDGANKDLDVLIYFWDSRDGPDLCGWWFGPEVGGEQVWAYHPSRSSTMPPIDKWSVPFDGSVDADFRVVELPVSKKRHHAAATSVGTEKDMESTPAVHPTAGSANNSESQSYSPSSHSSEKQPQDISRLRTEARSNKETQEDPPRKRERGSSLEPPQAVPAGKESGIEALRSRKVDRTETDKSKLETERKHHTDIQRFAEEQADRKQRKVKLEQQIEQSRAAELMDLRQIDELKLQVERHRRHQEGLRRQVDELDQRLKDEEIARKRREDEEKARRKREEEEELIKRQRQEEEARRRKEVEELEASRRRAEEAARQQEEEEAQKRRLEAARQLEEGEKIARQRKEEEEGQRRREERESTRQRRDEERRQEDRQRREDDRRYGDKQRGRPDDRGNRGERRRSRGEGRGSRGEERRGRGDDRGGRGENWSSHVDKRGNRGDDRIGRGDDRRGRGEDRGGRGRRDDSRFRPDSRGNRGDDRSGRGDDRNHRGEDSDRRDRGGRKERACDKEDRGGRLQDRENRGENRSNRMEDGTGHEESQNGRDDDRRRCEDEKPHKEEPLDSEVHQHHHSQCVGNEQKNDEKQNCVGNQNNAEDPQQEKLSIENDDGVVDNTTSQWRAVNDDLKKQKEEERKQKEDELQRKRDARRRQEEMNLKQQDELEQDKTRKKEEIEQKKGEEEQKKGEEEQKKGEEEQVKIREKVAMVNVLKVLQRFTNANLENFGQLKVELEETMAKELPNAGKQEEILKSEAQRVLAYTTQYIKRLRDQQQKQEDVKNVEDIKHVEDKKNPEQEAQEQTSQKQTIEEQEETAQKLLAEFEGMVVEAQNEVDGAYQAAVALNGDEKVDISEIFSSTQKVEEAAKGALSACLGCTEFIRSKRSQLDEAVSLKAEVVKVLAVLGPQIQTATKRAVESMRLVAMQKEKSNKNGAVVDQSDVQARVFQKHNKNCDGVFSRNEVCDYAKGVFDFELTSEILDKIFTQIKEPDAQGIKLSQMPQLMSAIGLARKETLDLSKNKGQQETKQQQEEGAIAGKSWLEEARVSLSSWVDKLSTTLTDIGPQIWHVEEASNLLTNSSPGQLHNETPGFVEIAAVRAQAQLAESKQAVSDLHKQVAKVEGLQELMCDEISDLDSRVDQFVRHLARVESIIHASRQTAANSNLAPTWAKVAPPTKPDPPRVGI